MSYYHQAFLRDFLKQIRRRPGIYIIPGESLKSLQNFLHGFTIGCGVMADKHNLPKPSVIEPTSLNEHFMEVFGLWCQKKYEVGGAGYWTAAEKLGGADDKQQFHAFFQLMDEFETEIDLQGGEPLVEELLHWEQKERRRYG
jgi:hypothetical protein